MVDKSPRIIVRSRKEATVPFPEQPVNGSEVYSVFGSERVFAGWAFRLQRSGPKPYVAFGRSEPAPKFLGWFEDHLAAHAALRAHAEHLRQAEAGAKTESARDDEFVKRKRIRNRKIVNTR